MTGIIKNIEHSFAEGFSGRRSYALSINSINIISLEVVLLGIISIIIVLSIIISILG